MSHLLADKWRAVAPERRGEGSEGAARIYEKCALELELWNQDYQSAELTLTEASEESGYSPSHLQRLVAEGRILNVGKRHAPRIRRMDLPKKPPIKL